MIKLRYRILKDEKPGKYTEYKIFNSLNEAVKYARERTEFRMVMVEVDQVTHGGIWTAGRLELR